MVIFAIASARPQRPGGGFPRPSSGRGLFFWYLAQSRARKLGSDNLGYTLIGIGMLLALCTGLLGFLQGSYLAPLHGTFLGQHLTTSLLFDGGIYFAVFGLIVVVINQLGGRDRPGNQYARAKQDRTSAKMLRLRPAGRESAKRTVAEAFGSPHRVRIGGSTRAQPPEVSRAAHEAERPLDVSLQSDLPAP